MAEARVVQLPASAQPAVGGGGRLLRNMLIKRTTVAVALILLLGLTKHFVGSREIGPDPLSALPGGRPVTTGLDIGGTPSDYDLRELASSFHVDGVVNLGGASVSEQVTAASLRQGYLHLAVSPDTPPTWVQLNALIRFMRSHTSQGDAVYLHDNVGGGQAVAAADMLLLVRGDTWSAVSQRMTPAEQRTLSRSQLQAVQQLISALSDSGHHVSAGNPYSSVRINSW